MLAMLRLDFKMAFYYHPLFWMMIPAAFVVFFRERIPGKVFYGLVVTACILFVAVYVARLFFVPGDVVGFHPENGLMWRIFRLLAEQV